MSDINKIVAAILTAGRVPTMGNSPRPMEDWLAEYNAWVDALQEQATEKKRAQASKYNEALKRGRGA